MAILSILAAFTVKKVNAIYSTAEENALIQGIAELNAREKMTWTKILLSDHGYQTDESLWSEIDLNLGAKYSWNDPPAKRWRHSEFWFSINCLEKKCLTEGQCWKLVETLVQKELFNRFILIGLFCPEAGLLISYQGSDRTGRIA